MATISPYDNPFLSYDDASITWDGVYLTVDTTVFPKLPLGEVWAPNPVAAGSKVLTFAQGVTPQANLL